MNKGHLNWKVLGLAIACIGCCALPLIIGLIGGSIGLFSATFFAESKEMLVLIGVALLLIALPIIVKRSRAKPKETCCVNCDCKHYQKTI